MISSKENSSPKAGQPFFGGTGSNKLGIDKHGDGTTNRNLKKQVYCSNYRYIPQHFPLIKGPSQKQTSHFFQHKKHHKRRTSGISSMTSKLAPNSSPFQILDEENRG